MNESYLIEAISPIFSYGATQNKPEIRPSSIRGQLHQWFRLLGGTFEQERKIFGGIKIKGSPYEDHASRLIVRISDIQGVIGNSPTLPHKTGGKAAHKACYLPGVRFKLHLMTRLGGLEKDEKHNVQRTLHTWMLLGGFGTRATRGGGSLQAIEPHLASTPEEWDKIVQGLTQGSPVNASLLPSYYTNEMTARKVISDTIGGQDDKRDGNNLEAIEHPLGVVTFGKEGKRKTSPLKLRVYRFAEDNYRIVAVWDKRKEVTNNQPHHLEKAIDFLNEANKTLGPELAQVSNQLTN